jgi:hypothetical protein
LIYKKPKREDGFPPSIYLHERAGKGDGGEIRGSALRVGRGVILYQVRCYSADERARFPSL